MTTKPQTYPKYKPSGIDWLGGIPAEWGVKKIKTFSEIVLGKMLDLKEAAEMHERPYMSVCEHTQHAEF